MRTKLSRLLLMNWLVAMSALVMLVFLALLFSFVTVVELPLPFGFGGLALLTLLAAVEAASLSAVLDLGKELPIGIRARRLMRVELRIGGVLFVVVIGLIVGGYGDTMWELEGTVPPMVAEMESIQTAMNALMADQQISEVVPADTSQNNLDAFPQYTVPDGRPSNTLDAYFTKRRSEFYYCWNKLGEITRLDQTPQPDCPDEYVALDLPPEPIEWLQGLYGVLIVTGVVVLTGLAMTLPNRLRARDDIQKYYGRDA